LLDILKYFLWNSVILSMCSFQFLLHCHNNVWSCRYIPVFWRNILPPSSGLIKMETVCTSETLVPIHMSTWYDNPEVQHRHLHRCEYLKSYILLYCCINSVICEIYSCHNLLSYFSLESCILQY
jgi:hypothetical protein